MKYLRITTLVALLLLYTGDAQAAPTSLKQAATNYKAGKYMDACNELKDIVRLQPNNVLAHYYLALSHQALGHVGDAKIQYQWVIERGDAKFRGFAQQGLAQLTHNSVRGSAQSFSPSSAIAPPGAQTAHPKVTKILEFYADW